MVKWWFYTDNEFLSMFDALVTSYPSKISKSSIGVATSGSTMWMYSIGNTSTDAKILIDGQLHGSEDMGSMVSYWLAEWLVEEQDGDAVDMLERNGIYLIPIVNINSYNWTVNIDYRTNNYTAGTCAYGIDMNRAFDASWSAVPLGNCDPDGKWKGPSGGFAEEVKVMQTLMTTLAPKVYINLHGGAPWTYIAAINNSPLASSIRIRTNELRIERDVPDVPSYNSPSTIGLGGPGYAIRYGRANAGIPCSWLLEVYDPWSAEAEDTIALQDTMYPSLLCHVIASAEITYEHYGSLPPSDPAINYGTDGWWSGWWS